MVNCDFGHEPEAACIEFGFVARLVAFENCFQHVHHCPAIEPLDQLVAMPQEHVHSVGFGVNTEAQQILALQQPDWSLDYLVDLAQR